MRGFRHAVARFAGSFRLLTTILGLAPQVRKKGERARETGDSRCVAFGMLSPASRARFVY